MNLKETLRSVAPKIAALAGGPLWGTGMKLLSEAILGHDKGSEADIEKAVTEGLSPEQLVAVQQADIRLKELDLDTFKTETADVASAREAHKNDPGVFYMGVSILIAYATVLTLTLIGAYWLLVKGSIKDMDAGLVAAVFSLIGAIIGYIASDAKQVVSYYFGSSAGSDKKTAAMAAAVTKLGNV